MQTIKTYSKRAPFYNALIRVENLGSVVSLLRVDVEFLFGLQPGHHDLDYKIIRRHHRR